MVAHKKNSALKNSLLSLLSTLPLAMTVSYSYAQSAPERAETRIKYVYYADYQGAGEDRMRVLSPMMWFNAPVASSIGVEGGLVFDALSGASPLYLDSLSGASGEGVRDNRLAGDLTFTKYFDNFSVGLGGALSDEDDYHSKSAHLQTRIFNDTKTTTFAFGASTDWDEISSSNNAEVDEGKKVRHLFTGITQVIDPVSMIQSNVELSFGRGFFTDPYKLFDNRPRSRDEYAWLTRYVRYLESLEGSLHLDYRLYKNSWEVWSHMVESSVYVPVSSAVTIRPGMRYYFQNAADFYSGSVPPSSFTTNFSADQRLSDFGGLSIGLKVIGKLYEGLELDVLYEYLRQTSALRIGTGSDGLDSFNAHYVEVGLAAKF